MAGGSQASRGLSGHSGTAQGRLGSHHCTSACALCLLRPSLRCAPRSFVSRGLDSRRHSPSHLCQCLHFRHLHALRGPTSPPHCFLLYEHKIQGCLGRGLSHRARRPHHRLACSHLYIDSRLRHLCLQPRLWSPHIPDSSPRPPPAAPFLRRPHPHSLRQEAWGHPSLLPFTSTFPLPPHLAQAPRSHTQTLDFAPLPQDLPKRPQPLG